MKTWKFKTKDSFSFKIEANSYTEAYGKAYETHGTQVEDMMYEEIINTLPTDNDLKIKSEQRYTDRNLQIAFNQGAFWMRCEIEKQTCTNCGNYAKESLCLQCESKAKQEY